MANVAASRYARALFMLAEEKALLREYWESARFLLDVLTENAEFAAIFRHAQIDSAEKLALIEKTFKGSVPDDFLGLMDVVIRKNQEPEMEHILERFILLAKDALRHTDAVVETASPLTEAQLSALNEKLARLTGKTVTLTVVEKPELLAGFRVNVDGRVLDGTIRQKLDAFKRQLLNLPPA